MKFDLPNTECFLGMNEFDIKPLTLTQNYVELLVQKWFEKDGIPFTKEARDKIIGDPEGNKAR